MDTAISMGYRSAHGLLRACHQRAPTEDRQALQERRLYKSHSSPLSISKSNHLEATFYVVNIATIHTTTNTASSLYTPAQVRNSTSSMSVGDRTTADRKKAEEASLAQVGSQFQGYDGKPPKTPPQTNSSSTRNAKPKSTKGATSSRQSKVTIVRWPASFT